MWFLWWLKILNTFVGSGKRALFEVISRRAQGPTRGQILLDGVPMSMRLFQVYILNITWLKLLTNDYSIRFFDNH